MLKRATVAILMLLLISGMSLCYAATTEKNIYDQAASVFELYNDCIYLYQNGGISYNQFSEMYTKASLQKNRFLTKNKDIPSELKKSIISVDEVFMHTRDMWDASIRYKTISKSKYTENLKELYPRLQQVKLNKFWGLYNANEMAEILGSYCIEYTKRLQDTIDVLSGKTPPTPPQQGKKYEFEVDLTKRPST